MKDSERGMPEVVFIGPPKRRHKFEHVIFRILTVKNGLPHTLVLLQNDDLVDTKGGEQFMTGYLPAACLESQ